MVQFRNSAEPSDATERKWRSEFFANQDHSRHFRPLIAVVRPDKCIGNGLYSRQSHEEESIWRDLH